MDLPFGGRILLLIVVAAVLSAIDYRKHRSQATGYLEYGFIFLAGILGAIIGGGNDAVTSTLSPEYFTIGKGLASPSDGRLTLDAIAYGLKVGFSGGVISGAILIYFSRRKTASPPASFGFLLRQLWIPILGAIAGALLAAAVPSTLDPFHLRADLESVIPTSRIPTFLRVWWIHAGLYAGLLLGVGITLRRVLRHRLTAVPPSTAP